MDNLKKVQEIISEEYEIPAEKIVREADLSKDLGLDSYDQLELIMAFESEFGREFKEDQLENIKTVGDIVDSLDALTD